MKQDGWPISESPFAHLAWPENHSVGLSWMVLPSRVWANRYISGLAISPSVLNVYT